MISADWVRMMAGYGHWQNAAHLAAADGLDDAARQQDRGAFFGSIQGTISHLVWGDMIWMSRFDGGDRPPGSIAESPALFPDWDALKEARAEMDGRITRWAAGLDAADLAGELAWHSAVLGRDVSRSKAICVSHFFNHGTHHRGQVHAMLTAAGARLPDSDLFMMPGLP